MVRSRAPLILLAMLLGCPAEDKLADTGLETEEDSQAATDSDPCAEIVWYPDADGDGFGDALVPIAACEAPEGLIAEGTDCDDADAGVYPGATEICGDGRVNNCNDEGGVRASEQCTPPGPFSVQGADWTLYGESEAGQAGKALADAGDTNGDGRTDLLIAAPEASNSIGGTGIVYLVLGPGDSYTGLEQAEASFVTIAAIGSVTTSAGDADADGYADLWITGPRSGVTGSGEGASWLAHGPVSGEIRLSLSEITFSGNPGEHAGTSAAGVGDLDGDGWEDAAIGAPDVTGGPDESMAGDCAVGDWEEWGREYGNWAGAVYVLLGPISGENDPLDAHATLYGEDGEDQAGKAMADVGDLDGDGLADLFFSAYNNCESYLGAGAAYVHL